jgi:glycosyltransferase involved in cell wall biosynthesis
MDTPVTPVFGSLVIPCYNEAANIPLLLERCALVTATRPDVEIILVNNGSTDDSAEVLQDLLPHYPGCRSVHVVKNQGYGFGIISGLKAAAGQVVGWTHADMQTDPQDFLTALAIFDRHGLNQLVKGRRYGRPLGDTVFTMGMSAFETVLLGKPLWDINAQPTVFPKTFLDQWQDPPHDFSLDLYAYYQAQKAGLRIRRFPVLFGKRAFGTSHWNINWAAKRKFIKRTVDFSFQLKKNLG